MRDTLGSTKMKELCKSFLLPIFQPDEVHKYLRNLVTSLTKSDQDELLNATNLLSSPDFVQDLRYIARLYGLPTELSLPLQKLITSELSEPSEIEILINAALALKYSTLHNLSFLTVTQIITCIELSLGSQKISLDTMTHNDIELRSNLVLTMCLVISSEFERGSDPVAGAFLEQMSLRGLNAEAKEELLKLRENFNLGQVDLTIGSGGKIPPKNLGTEGFNPELFSQGGINKIGNGKRTKRRPNVAHAVKTQQLTVANSKSKESEKLELANISLLKALNSRSKTVQKSVQRSAIPKLISTEGSAQCWYKNTLIEVRDLGKMAKSAEPISGTDQNYLITKLDDSQKWAPPIMFAQIDLWIAEGFYHMSKNRQAIKPSHLLCLMQNAKSKERAYIYTGKLTDFKKWALKTVDDASMKDPKLLTEDILQIITEFLTHSESSLRNLAFTILAKNSDGNAKIAPSLFEQALQNLFSESIEDRDLAFNVVNRQSLISENCEELFTPEIVSKLVSEIKSGKAIVKATKGVFSKFKLRIDKTGLLKKLSVGRRIYESSLVSSVVEEAMKQAKRKPKLMVGPDVLASNLRILEILENYLEHEVTSGLSSEILNEFLDFIDLLNSKNEVEDKIQLSLIRCVVRTYDKIDSDKLPPPLKGLLPRLVNIIESEPMSVASMILILLKRISSHVEIPDCEVIILKLVQNDQINLDGTVFPDSEASDDTEGISISAMVAEIILNSKKPYWLQGKSCLESERTLTYLVQAVRESRDKQTRILAAECLFNASNGENLSDFILQEMKGFTSDSVSDVEVYCTAGFAIGIRKLSSKDSKPVPKSLLEILPQTYAFSKLALDQKDFTSDINSAILTTLLQEARKLVGFSDGIFKLISYVILKSTDAPDCALKGLQIIEEFCSCQLKLSHKIPYFVIESIEGTWAVSPEMKSIADRIMSFLIQRGQAVPSSVLERLAAQFFYKENDSSDDGDERFKAARAINLLFLTNRNQDLPERIFGIFNSEMIGIAIAKSNCLVKKANNHILNVYRTHTVNMLAIEQISIGLSVLNSYVSKGLAISRLNFEALELCIRNDENVYKALECLISASENLQNLPSSVLRCLNLNKFGGQGGWDLFMNLSISLMKNSQVLPIEMANSLTNSFESAMLNGSEKIINFLSYFFDSGGKMEISKLIKLHSISEKDPKIARKFLGVVYSALLKSKDFDGVKVSKICEFYFKAINRNWTELTPQAILGIHNINQQTRSDYKLTLDDNQINTLVSLLTYKGNEKFIDVQTRLLLKSILTQFELNSEQKSAISLADLLSLSNDTEFLEKALEFKVEFLGSQGISRVQRVIESENLSNEWRIVGLDLISKTFVIFAPSEELLTSVAVIMTQSDKQELKFKCMEVLKVAFRVGTNFSNDIVEVLKSEFTFTKDLLLLISSKQEDFNPQIKFLLEIGKLIEEKDPTRLIKNLENISSEIRAGLVLEEVTIKQLLRFKDNTKVVTVLANMFGNLVLKSETKISTTIAEILQASILTEINEQKLDNEVYSCFRLAIERNLINFNPEIDKKLMQHFIKANGVDQKSSSILKCLSALVSKMTKIDESIENMFIHNLQNEDESIRRSSFHVLKCHYLKGNISQEFLLFVQSFLEEILGSSESEDFDKETKSVLNKCSNVKSYWVNKLDLIYNQKTSIKLDGDFLEIIETLLSVETWDFGVINKLPPSKWPRQLLISDFITNLASNKGDELLLYQSISKIADKWSNTSELDVQETNAKFCLANDTNEILYQLLSAILDTNLSMPAILDLLDSIKDLECKTVWEIISKGQRHWVRDIEFKSLQTILQSKFGLKSSTNIVDKLAKLLSQNCELSLSKDVLIRVSQINDIKLFEKLVALLKKHEVTHLKFARKQVPLVELNLSIHLQVLQENFVQKNKVFLNLFKDQKLYSVLEYLLISDLGNFNIILNMLNFKISKYSEIEAKGIYYLFKMLSDYDVGSNLQEIYPKLKSILLEVKSKEWTKLINELILDHRYPSGVQLKSVSDIFLDYCNLNCEASPLTLKNPDEVEIIFAKISKGNFSTSLPNIVPKQDICAWSKYDISLWALQVQRLDSAKEQNFIVEMLAVAKRAYFLTTNFNLTNAQILSLLVATTKGSIICGQLQQVTTGSGKSTIIAILAVVQGLQSNYVDIYTSNGVLAERDAKQWEPFYRIFNLTCSHNGDKAVYTSGLKPCYRRSIVYGETAQFQFDTLRDSYSALGTLGGRKNNFALIDEVDSIFIDDCSKLARLSSQMPGMDLFQTLYHFIWHRLFTIEQKLFTIGNTLYFMEGQISFGTNGVAMLEFADKKTLEIKQIEDVIGYIQLKNDLSEAGIHVVEDVESFVSKHLKDFMIALTSAQKVQGFESNAMNKFKIPQHLVAFVNSQISKWIESAITAMNYQENVHYVVEKGQICPVEFSSTGVIQASTNWSDGLHQFLQLKHKLKMTTETITTNFMSNSAMFSKYSHNIIGFSGTLGSLQAQSFIQEIYKTRSVFIPNQYQTKYIQLPDISTSSRDDWLDHIASSTVYETCKGRGVLIICESIKMANLISDQLKSLHKSIPVRLYTKNNSGQEKNVQRIHPGEVIVATNLAGRGTDITTCDIEPYGGLHVCLTFLPTNSRVEDQAFGRTSRQGNYGTGQLITIANSTFAKNVREIRDNLEKIQVEEFLNRDFKLNKVKDECFARFCCLLGATRKQLSEHYNSWDQKDQKNFVMKSIEKAVGNWGGPSIFETNVLQAIEEKWALFLRQVDDGKIIPENALSLYEKEIGSICELKALSGDEINSKILEIIQSPFYHIIIANDLFLNDSKMNSNSEKAKLHFQKAISLDKDFASGALVGLGYLLLKGDVRLAQNDKYEVHYKTKAAFMLQEALKMIQEEVAQIITVQSLLQQRAAGVSVSESNKETDLFKQLTTKVNILGSYSNCIQAVLATTKRSLRCFDFIFKDKFSNSEGFPSILLDKEGQLREMVEDVKKESIDFIKSKGKDGFNKVDLIFNDLTFRYDCGDIDQAINTISNHSANLNLSCSSLNLDRIMKITTPHIYIDHVTKKQALEALKSFESSVTKVENYVTDKIGLEFDAEKFSEQLVVQITIKKAEEEPKFLAECPNIERARKQVVASGDDVNLCLVIKDANKEHFDNLQYTKFDLKVINLNFEKAQNAIKLVEHTKLDIHIVAGIPEFQKLVKADIPNPSETNISKFFPNGTFTTTKFNEELLSKHADIKTTPPVTAIQISNLTDEQAIKFISTCEAKKIDCIFELKLKCVQRQSIVSNRLELDTLLNQSQIIFQEIKPSKAKEVIPFLRKLSFEFQLHFLNLSIKDAQNVIQSAELIQEDIAQSSIKSLSDLYTSEWIPTLELVDLASRGVLILCEFNEKQFIPWYSVVGVVALGVVQMGIGVFLVCTGFGATVGIGFITEGASDLFTAYRAYSTRQFSWADYGKQKAVSLAISAVSMGLSSLKDAVKGTSTVVTTAVATEFTEQAGTRLIMNGKTVGTIIQASGSNLRTLAFKQVGVAVGEAALREGLNTAMDGLVNFTMSQAKPQILAAVESNVKERFRTNEALRKLLKNYWALDEIGNSKRLESTVESFMQSITSPQSNRWTKEWNAIGWPLCRGVLSDSKLIGGSFSSGVRLLGMLNGLTEIITVVERVVTELVSKLDLDQLSVAQMLHSHCKVNTITEANAVAKFISINIDSSNDSKTYTIKTLSADYQHYEQTIVPFFKRYEGLQRSFSLQEISQVLKIIIESIANHVIKIADTQLISPVSTLAVGYVVTGISTFVQTNLVVSKNHNTDEMNKDGISAETISQQIHANAQVYCQAYEQRHIIAKIMEIKSKEAENANQPGAVNTPSVVTEIGEIANDNPAKISTMFTMAENNNINMNIVDEDYQPTEEDKRSGVKLVVFKEGDRTPEGGETVGHYCLKDYDGKFIDPPSTGNKCGYQIMEILTGKSVNELKSQTIDFVVNNANEYRQVLKSEEWLSDRYPLQANRNLLRGGAKRQRLNTNDENDPRSVVNKPPKSEVKVDQTTKIKGEWGGVEEEFPTDIDITIPLGVANGSKPNREARLDTRTLNEALGSGKDYISGHLVSEKLAGEGKGDNITPMTRSLNSVYEKVFESKLKQLNEEFKGQEMHGASFKGTLKLSYKTLKGRDGKNYTVLDEMKISVKLDIPQGGEPNDSNKYSQLKDMFIDKFKSDQVNFDRKGKTDRDPKFTTTFKNDISAETLQQHQEYQEDSSSSTGSYHW